MAGPKLLPEIGTGLKNVKQTPITESIAKPEQVATDIQQPEQRRAPRTSLNQLMKMRRGIINDLSKGTKTEDQILGAIQEAGIQDPETVETLLSTNLNDNVIRFFLKNTKNDPKKAKALAKKFGFEV